MKFSFVYWHALRVTVLCILCCCRGQFMMAEQADARIADHFREARLAQDAGEFDKAAQEYQEVLRLQPDIAEVYANLGFVYNVQTKFEASAAALQKALALKPQLPGVDLVLGIDRVKLSQPARALPALTKAVQQEPGNKDAASWLATALWDSGQTTAALSQLRKTAADFPSDCEVLFLLGEAYQKAANLQLEYVTRNAVGTPVYHQAFGSIYADQGVWDKATGHFRAALEKNPAWKGAHFGLGDVYSHQGKWTEAEREFEQEIKIDPSSAPAFARLGNVAISRGDISAALRGLNAAIQISPDNAANALGLPALSYSAGGDKPDEEVTKAYERGLSALDTVAPSPAAGSCCSGSGRSARRDGYLSSCLDPFCENHFCSSSRCGFFPRDGGIQPARLCIRRKGLGNAAGCQSQEHGGPSRRGQDLPIPLSYCLRSNARR